MLHGTPPDVVNILKKHIPAKSKYVLEPAVGKGALLTPFLSSKFKSLIEITAIDIDLDRLNCAKNIISTCNARKNFQQTSFLDYNFGEKKYDCIVMNPPFNAKMDELVLYESKKTPIEIAFVKKCLSLLENKGRLIAILPISLIAGCSQKNFRKSLLQELSIKKVYELNRFSFPKIEGQFYILVADKSANTKFLKLEKAFSNKSASLQLPLDEIISNDYRLDFSYHFSQIKLQALIENHDFKWTALGEIASIKRGDFTAPTIPKDALHTHNFKNGFWESGENISSIHSVIVQKNDILLKRISRNCQNTFGIYEGNSNVNFSDCIFRIRPKDKIDPIKLIFSLRTLYSTEIGKHLLVKGSGANYITASTLKSTYVPVDLPKRFKNEYQAYQQYHRNKNWAGMSIIEQNINKKLLTLN